MADGVRKNLQVTWRQVKDSAILWWHDVKLDSMYLVEAAKDRDVPEVLHKLTALLGSTLKFFLRLDRLWLYVLLALLGLYLGSITDYYQWPTVTTWRGF